MKPFFLNLVLFFLAGTTYSQIWLDNSCPLEEKVSNEKYTSAETNNLLTLILDQEGKLLINGKESQGISEIKFKESIYDFITNTSKDKNKADSPKQAIIALGAYGEHDSYELILRYVREVYLYAWDTAAEEKFDDLYMDLDCNKRKKVRNSSLPYNVIELNNDKKEKKPNLMIGVPPFKGDVIDN